MIEITRDKTVLCTLIVSYQNNITHLIKNQHVIKITYVLVNRLEFCLYDKTSECRDVVIIARK